MGNDAGNMRRVERQAEYRKKKQMRRKMFSLILVLILVILALRVRELNACLAEVQTTLKRIEALQQKDSGDDARADSELTGEQMLADYISYAEKIEPVNVGKPVKRTREEAVQRLKELGQTNETIARISQDSSLYPEDMLIALANNPEMAEFVAGYLSSDRIAFLGLTDSEKEQDYPLFLQWDPRWGYVSYGKDGNIGLSGCGPTCLSMVLYYLTGNETLTPDKIADYAMKSGYYVEGTGTAWALMKDVPGLYGVRTIEPELSEYAWREALGKGRMLICAMGAGDFTVAGHFIVICGYDENGFIVNDPNCIARSNRRWSFDEIRRQVKMVWAYEVGGQQVPFEEQQVITFVDFAG